MDDFSKIALLIDSKSAENNYLAMQLMMTLLHYSFEEAYSHLIPAYHDDDEVFLEIGEIRIVYKVDLQRIIYAASSYADIERLVYFRGIALSDSKKRLYADDDSILGLGEFGTVDELVEIKEDIIGLCPLVKELWERTE